MMRYAPRLTPQEPQPQHLKGRDFCGASYPDENKKLSIGIYHAIVNMPSQEDALSIALLNTWQQLSSLSSEKRNQVLPLVFAVMEECFGKDEIGSTASVAIIEKKKNPDGEIVLDLHLAHLGDSPVYFVTEEKAEQIIKPHKLSDETEQKRIIEAGGHILDGTKVGGRLAISRAFGNRKIIGISHEPTITQKTLPLKKHNFVLLASDGLSDVLNEDQIFRVIIENKSEPPGSIAFALSRLHHDKLPASRQRGDNTSAVIVPIDMMEIGDVIYVGVFDGHGGPDVSSKIAERFSFVLKRTIVELFDKKDTETIKKKIISDVKQYFPSEIAIQSDQNNSSKQETDPHEKSKSHSTTEKPKENDRQPTSSSLTLKILCACTFACLAIGLLTGTIALAGGFVMLATISKISFFAASTLLITTACCALTNDNKHGTPKIKS